MYDDYFTLNPYVFLLYPHCIFLRFTTRNQYELSIWLVNASCWDFVCDVLKLAESKASLFQPMFFQWSVVLVPNKGHFRWDPCENQLLFEIWNRCSLNDLCCHPPKPIDMIYIIQDAHWSHMMLHDENVQLPDFRCEERRWKACKRVCRDWPRTICGGSQIRGLWGQGLGEFYWVMVQGTKAGTFKW